MSNLWIFISLTFLVSASPGPAMLTCLADGARFGLKRCSYTMLGISAGNIILMLGSSLGLGLLIQQLPWLFDVIKWLGAAYLAYLGLSLAFSKTMPLDLSAIPAQRHRLFSKALLVSLSNPKGLIYFGALFPQFINAEQSLAWQLVVLSIIFLSTDMLWMIIYAAGGRALIRWLESPLYQKIFNYGCGLALIMAAIALALSHMA